jgi:RHS repeat-associated protein
MRGRGMDRWAAPYNYSPAQNESFAYYPYGEERTNRVNAREKFATYFRDAVGQDYADQRYYNSGTGQFFTADPGGIKTAKSDTPLSWNRYVYVNGDPINFLDRHGLEEQVPDYGDCDPNLDCDPPECYDPSNEFLGQPDPGCSTGGGGDPSESSTTSTPTSKPTCPPKIQNFFNIVTPLADQIAAKWDTDAVYILALAAYESGWLDPHNQALHNPFGLTNAGGNNINFASYQAAANYWSQNDGKYIENDASIAAFTQDLQPHYNTVTSTWAQDVTRVFNTVLNYLPLCDH